MIFSPFVALLGMTASAVFAATTPSAAPSHGIPHRPARFRLVCIGASPEIAGSVLQYQSKEGGWPKNTNLAIPPRSAADIPSDGRENTFDNDGTTLPMKFLARVIHAGGNTNIGRHSIVAWPTPSPRSTQRRMAAVLSTARRLLLACHVQRRRHGPGHGLVPRHRRRTRAIHFCRRPSRKQSARAEKLGIDLILRTQIRQNGELTAWCAQYDEHTLEPTWARRYEPPSLSGSESVGIIRFLMSIDKPTPQIVAAVEGGIRWFRDSALTGIRVERFTNADGKPDRQVAADPTAGPLWARFYELGSNRPIFLGRDSVFHYTFAEIEHERRNGYSYYGAAARPLLEVEFPAWRAAHAP